MAWSLIAVIGGILGGYGFKSFWKLHVQALAMYLAKLGTALCLSRLGLRMLVSDTRFSKARIHCDVYALAKTCFTGPYKLSTLCILCGRVLPCIHAN
jgi:hypothetical protein